MLNWLSACFPQARFLGPTQLLNLSQPWFVSAFGAWYQESNVTLPSPGCGRSGAVRTGGRGLRSLFRIGRWNVHNRGRERCARAERRGDRAREGGGVARARREGGGRRGEVVAESGKDRGRRGGANGRGRNGRGKGQQGRDLKLAYLQTLERRVDHDNQSR